MMKSQPAQPAPIKTYVEASSQTIDEDLENCSTATASVRIDFDCEIQTDSYNLKPLQLGDRQLHDTNKRNIAFGLSATTTLPNSKCEDQSDDDSSPSGEEQELQRRLNPSRPEDFETLQSELLLWRRREERKIVVTSQNVEHKQAMTKALLNKEACLLRKIDSLKNAASEKRKSEETEYKMEKLSQTKLWEMSDGSFIEVDTHETRRAREMKLMYDKLRQKVDKGKLRRCYDFWTISKFMP